MVLTRPFAPSAPTSQLRVTSPAIEVAAAESSSATMVWDLLQSSCYLDETTASLRTTLASAYHEYWRRHANGGDDIVLVARCGQPIGTVGSARIGGGTWMMHHFGIDAAFRARSARDKKLAIRALLGGMVGHLQDARAQRLVVTCARHKPFNVATYHAFAARAGDRARCSVRDLTIHKIDPCAAALVEAGRGPELPSLMRREWSDLEGWHRERAPQVASAALELTTDRPRGAQQLGFAHRVRGRLAAAVVVEIGGLGSNLFGLRNTMRVFDLGLSPSERNAVTNALVHAALAAFRASGEREALLLADAESLPPPTGLPFAPGIAAMHFAIAREVLPAWIEHLDEVCAARPEEAA